MLIATVFWCNYHVVKFLHSLYLRKIKKMKKLLLIVLSLYSIKGFTQNYDDSNIVPGELIVKFSDNALNLQLIDDSKIRFGELIDILQPEYYDLMMGNDQGIDFSEVTYRKLTRFKTTDTISISRTGRRISVPHFWAVLNLQFDDAADLNVVNSWLNEQDYILYAHNNWRVDYYGANDSLFADQTNLHATTFPDGMINVDSAWTLETGKPFVKVGVSDSGFDTTHIDLEMFYGYMYGQYTGTLETWYEDFMNHGTACAGIIGATRNNEIGIAGIAAGDSIGEGVRMYGLSLTDDPLLDWGAVSIIEAAYDSGDDTGFDSWNQNENQHGYGFGLHMLNCSWGAPVAAKEGEEKGLDPNTDNFVVELNCRLCYEAGEFAYRNGMIIVAARGNAANQNDTTLSFPATFSIEEAVVSVGGAGLNGNAYNPNVNAPVINSGNWPLIGRKLDVIAPYSDTMVQTIDSRIGLMNPQNNNYRGFSGTSGAAPQVTGIVALMLSYYNVPDCYSYDNLAPEDVEHVLEYTSTDKGLVGYDDWTGHGLVNAYQALKALEKPKYRIFHSHDSMIVQRKVELVATDTIVCLASPYTNFGPLAGSLGLSDGAYFADVYKVSHVYNHAPWTSSTSDTVLGVWSRGSDSEGLMLKAGRLSQTPTGTIVLCDDLETRPIAYIESYDNNEATLYAYYYKIKEEYLVGNPLNHWLPVDTSQARLSYSLYSFDPNRTTNQGFNCDSLTQYDVDYSSVPEQANHSITLFPNPAFNEVNVKSSVPLRHASIFSVNGELLIRKHFESKEALYTLELPDLPEGLYMVRLNDQEGNVWIKKLIKL